MVSLVVPTRNRCYTLRLVARSWYAQRNLDEIVFVDDCGEDDTRAFVDELKLEFSSPTTKYLRNPVRRGAAASRSVGVAHANGGYVCFCDDDEYLEGDYLIGCLEYLERTGVGAVSGRRLYMNVGETIAQTIARCGSGEEGRPYFKSWLCEVDDRGFLAAVESLPLVNAIILTRKSDLERFGFDDYYFRGNGYREESDYQMQLFLHGLENIMLSSVHSLHLPLDTVRVGGARPARKRGLTKLLTYYWTVYNNAHFYKKYWRQYSKKMNIPLNLVGANIIFALYHLRRQLLKPAYYVLVGSVGRAINR